MISNLINFDCLFTNNNVQSLLHCLLKLEKQISKKDNKYETVEVKLKNSKLKKTCCFDDSTYQTTFFSETQTEKAATDQLI